MSVLLGQTLPAKEVRVSGTTLYHVAARELGDATLWERIAALNGIVDPWIAGARTLQIPRLRPGPAGAPGRG